MGKRTSVYLADDLAAAVEKVGLPLAELIHRGIYGPPARPVVVPIRRDVPQSADAVVVPPADDAGSAPAPVPHTAGASDDPPMARPCCPGCHWRAAQPVPAGDLTACESCGYGFVVEAGQ